MSSMAGPRMTPKPPPRIGTRQASATAACNHRFSCIIGRRSPRTSGRPLPRCPAGEGTRLGFQVLAEKPLDVLPQLLRRAFAIARPVIGEKGVAGAIIDLRRDLLAGGLRALLQLPFQSHRRVLVLGAEHAE